MDFTLKTYTQLLKSLIKAGYSFQPFEQFIENPLSKVVILRHDVDRLPENSLKMAQLETSLGIRGSYYFRTVPSSFNEEIIHQIAEFGHEVGYHYEDVSQAARLRRAQGHKNITTQHHNGITKKGVGSKKYVVGSRKIEEEDYERYLAGIAIVSFRENLQMLRKIAVVKTICMHGSPMSRWDNRLMWKYYNYRDFGIIGEPYFDVDYSKVFYITDTGRRWNNKSSNVRDLVNRAIDIPIKSTAHLISLIQQEQLPDHLMINTHPHRWFEGGLGWYRELLMQNTKNAVKRIILGVRHDI